MQPNNNNEKNVDGYMGICRDALADEHGKKRNMEQIKHICIHTNAHNYQQTINRPIAVHDH